MCHLPILNIQFWTIFTYVTFCVCLKSRIGCNDKIKFRNTLKNILFVNDSIINSHIGSLVGFHGTNFNNYSRNFNRGLTQFDTDVDTLDDDVSRVLYGLQNLNELKGPYIDSEGRVVNKKKKLYSTGELCHVDDFFEGKFKVEWTVRGVKEKLQYRYRDTHTRPLTTSRFKLAGIKGFVLRLWLDGHKCSKKGHIAMSLVQQEHWSSLDSPICLFAGDIVRGPFFYRSPEYFVASKSLCRLEDVVKDNTLKVGVIISKRDD